MRLFSLIVLCLAAPAVAGYRVHELKLTYYDPQGKVEKTDTVLSILDQLQYEHYHSGYGNMKVELADTWYCPGDTSRRDFCPKPSEPKRGPASTDPKRLPLNRQPVIP